MRLLARILLAVGIAVAFGSCRGQTHYIAGPTDTLTVVDTLTTPPDTLVVPPGHHRHRP